LGFEVSVLFFMKIFIKRSVILLPFPFSMEYCTKGGAADLHRTLRAKLLTTETTDAKRAVDDGLFISRADGEGIDAAPIEMGENACAVVDKSDMLPSPEVEVGEGILAASGGTGE
jgi:hypothetical protein